MHCLAAESHGTGQTMLSNSQNNYIHLPLVIHWSNILFSCDSGESLPGGTPCIQGIQG